MEIFEILKAKEIDIYISLFMTILGLILGLIIDSFRKKQEPNSVHNTDVITSVTVNSIIKLQPSNNSTPSNDEGLVFLIGLLLLATGTIYLFNRLEILNSIYYITVFVISLWSGGILHSLFKGRFTGWRWVVNLVFYSAFFVATFLIVNKAISPNHAPENFKHAQQLINEYGLLGLSDYFTLLGLKWFIFHLVGVMLLFFAMIRLTFSATYFAVMGGYIFSGDVDRQEPWLARRTRKYARFWKNIVVTSILLFISYYLIAGDFFMWFEYVFPTEMESFINNVLHGG